MLATTTTDTLGIVDSAILKKLPSSVPPCLDLIATPIASAWSPDNINLFIASSRTIHKYNSLSNTIRGIYEVEGSESIRALVSKEKNVVIFSLDHHVNILQFHNSETHTVQTLALHKAPVTSLSLSNDNSLLASGSTGVVYVHNIASGSHTVLRGLGNGAPGSTSVTFHMHFRTRLLVSLARQIFVYDTTRPSGPLKTIPLTESSPGDIVALSCSPFSKTLVAVATSMGFVVMIDLEKEKPQLRTVNMKTNPTALEFSPEGGAVYLGTDDGKLLVVDLRSLDKPAKMTIVSDIGDPIRTLSIQVAKRTKMNAEGVAKTPRSDVKIATKTPSEPLPPLRRTASTAAVSGTSKSLSKTTASPVQRAGKTAVVPPPASRRLASSTTEGFAASPLSAKTAVAQKKVLSPVKDPLGNMNDLLYTLGEVRPKKPATTPLNAARQETKESIKSRPPPSPRSSVRGTGRSQSSSKSTLDPKQLRRSRTLPSHKSVVSPEERASLPIHSTSELLCVPEGPPRRRERPSAPRSGSVPAGQSPSISTSTAASRPPSSTTGPESSKNLSGAARNNTSMTSKPSCTVVSSACSTSSRTPSPGIPHPLEPRTPEFKRQKNQKSTGMKVLGLGTPEVERWINAGKGEDRKVGKGEEDENNVKGKPKTVYFKDEDEDPEAEELMERARKHTLQISPRRPVPSASGSTADSWAGLAANSPALSVISHPPNTSAASSSPPVTSTAHDLLKTIVQDVMFDFQRETKAEMMGLHLDLLRMGRSWKTELRSLMDEYVGDLREMREENERLRRENERFKRGWQ